MRRRPVALALFVGISLLGASTGRAATLAFSDASSDSTPAAWLAATLSYTLIDPLTLQISVRNDTSQELPFDITMIFFNALPEVEYLSLVSAESSVDGENTSAWHLGYYGYDRRTASFGEFDYSLRTEFLAPAADRIAPGEIQDFTLSAFCSGYVGCAINGVLGGWSEDGYRSASAALRFEFGPQGDAAFGALTTPVPEGDTGALVGIGLVALAAAHRRR